VMASRKPTAACRGRRDSSGVSRSRARVHQVFFMGSRRYHGPGTDSRPHSDGPPLSLWSGIVSRPEVFMSGHNVIDVTDATFKAAVLDESNERTVIVDFWAPWCGPCRALSPVLERLAAEGEGRFVVAKVNTDDNPRFAGEFGVRGIPAVFAVKGGEVVDSFTGALPEPSVRMFLDKVAPSPIEGMARAGLSMLSARKDDAAAKAFDSVRAIKPTDPRALLGLAVIAARAGRNDDARALLASVATIPPTLAPLAAEVRTRLDAVDVDSARAAVAAAPDNVEVIARTR
jgi:putative thioredoxin